MGSRQSSNDKITHNKKEGHQLFSHNKNNM